MGDHQQQHNGFFSSIFRSFGLRQDHENRGNGSGTGQSSSEQRNDTTASPAHDVEMTVNSNSSNSSGIDNNDNTNDLAAQSTTPMRTSNQDIDMPPLQDASDSEDSDELAFAPIPASSTTSNVSSQSASPAPPMMRTGQRRARVEDDDEGDRERDRRHPSQRAAQPLNVATGSSDTIHNDSTAGSSNATATSSDTGFRNATTLRHSLLRALPFARSPIPGPSTRAVNTLSAGTPHYHIIHHHSDGLGGGVPGVGLRAAGDSRHAPPPHEATFSDMFAHFRADNSTPVISGATTSESLPQRHTQPNHLPLHSHIPHTNAGPSITIPVPIGAIPTLLRALGDPAGGNVNSDENNNPQATNNAAVNNQPPANANANGVPNPIVVIEPPPMLNPGGGHDMGTGLPFHLFNQRLFEERERDDPVRARQIVDGLEEVAVGLVQRLERANKALGEDEGSGCAVCWESLIGGHEVDWGTKKETAAPEATTATDPSTPQDNAATEIPNTEPKLEVKKNRIVALPCSHLFHSDCLIPWFSRPRQTTCPVCRFDLDPDSRIWGRRRRGMGFGGLFGAMGGAMGGAPAGGPEQRDNGVLADLLALAELSRMINRRRDETRPGDTQGPEQTPGAQGPGQGAASVPPPNSTSTNQAEAPVNPTQPTPGETNDGPRDPLQAFAEQFVRSLLGTAMAGAADGGNGGDQQPRVRVVNGPAGGPIQIFVDVTPNRTGQNAQGPAVQPQPADVTPNATPQAATSTPTRPGNSPPGHSDAPTPSDNTGNRERRHRPLFSIGFDMILGGPPPPGFAVPQSPSQPSQPPQGFTEFPEALRAARAAAMSPNGAPRSSASPIGNPTPAPTASQPVGFPPNINIDQDGDVVMEFEHVFHFGGGPPAEGEETAPHPPAEPSMSTEPPNTLPSSPPTSSERHTAQASGSSPAPAPVPAPAGTLESPDGRTEYRFFTGVATSMEDAMRQIQETIGSQIRNGAIPPHVMRGPPRPAPPPTHTAPLPTGGPSLASRWDANFLSQFTSPAQSGATPTAAPPPPPVHEPQAAPASTPTQGPQAAQENDDTLMTFDQFLRSWNGEAGRTTLPPLPPVATGPPLQVPRAVPIARAQRPARRGFGEMFMAAANANHGRSPSPVDTAEQPKWAPPPPPGPTLRERVEKKEREGGLRCWDMSCGLAPSDEDPLVVIDSGNLRQVHIKKKAPALDKGKGKAKDVDEASNEDDVCEHTFHPACLVSASRVANSLWSTEGDNIDGDEVDVACPICRTEGIISKEVWQEGVAGC